jgi:hypothetical protein
LNPFLIKKSGFTASAPARRKNDDNAAIREGVAIAAQTSPVDFKRAYF